ncbi:4611_t:CDS:10 [Paraglomus occultum]|uniref:4611_t:CDS:1 n=1 Tax=Paraglomus occultum TaxID=144539 RepID=A0A9N8W7R4_9GLOM|nr:4611_t:CDS:10 [Paraglomus occultum]
MAFWAGSNVEPAYSWPEPAAKTELNDAPEENVSPTRMKLNSALNALTASPDYSRVAFAAREGLRILNVNEDDSMEEIVFRVRPLHKFGLNDVKWGNAATRQKVAGAGNTVNTGIVIWDLGGSKPKVERIITEHTQVVNRICFNPTNGHYLLSASHSSTMKLWDLRVHDQACMTFEGRSDAVRDVQFNKLNFNQFAAAFDTGIIQKWDMRRPNMFERRINAHIGAALAVDWHPDGNHIASCGRDKKIKIWSDKLVHSFSTIQGVSRIQWRPDHPDEIASCAMSSDCRIFIWDVRKPYVASCFFEEHEETPTGFLWKDADILWSCSKDKLFIQQNISVAYRTSKLMNKSAVGWNVYGGMAFALVKTATENKPNMAHGGLSRRVSKPHLSGFGERDKFHQKAGMFNSAFDHKAFRYLTDNYELEADNIAAACEKNAKAALDVQKYRTSQTWKMVGLLFGRTTSTRIEENEIRDNTEIPRSSDYFTAKETHEEGKDEVIGEQIQPPSPDATTAQIDTKEDENLNGGVAFDTETDKTIDLSHDDSASDSDDDYQIEKEIIPDVNPPPPPVSKVKMTAVIRAWDHEPVIQSVLDYYAEQADVQMCVALVLVLGDRINVSRERKEPWFCAYIELLQRFQLWTAAATVISLCDIPSIRQMNQESTTIYTNCNSCGKALTSKNGFWSCQRCRKLLSSCSICHTTVKGLYAWCQGCSHGGHLQCLKGWFKDRPECPTGCGHRCGPKVTRT